LSKKKLTNKELTKAVVELNNNVQFVYNKVLHIDSLLGLYLEYRGDTEEFNKFVKARAEEFEKQQRSENKKGA
tara:strand:- start:977 stop:1195 length:219 start_codon:yes stop_codon:yes gene_type:complete